MFPRRYFAAAFFAPRYYPQSQGEAVAAGGTVRASAGGGSRVSASASGGSRVGATAGGGARVAAAARTVSN